MKGLRSILTLLGIQVLFGVADADGGHHGGGGGGGGGHDQKYPLCTNVSTVTPVDYKYGEPCCTVKPAEPYCKESKETVEKYVEETICDLKPTPNCYMKDCPVNCKTPEYEKKEYYVIQCDERPKTLYHYKLLPECHNVSKPICVEEWRTDSYGRKTKVVTDKCEYTYWEECNDVQKKVPFKTTETYCHKSHKIEYHKCVEKEEQIKMKCWHCEADAVPVCRTVKTKKSIEVPVIWCEPRTKKMCGKPKKEPFQTPIHQEKCLQHDDTMGPPKPSYDPVPPPPTYNSKPPTTSYNHPQPPTISYSPQPTYSQPSYKEYFRV